MIVEGNLVDVVSEKIYPARVTFNRKIISVERTNKKYSQYILPGFIDAHIHIESSMLCPSSFAKRVVSCGTTCVISDPHEIANVLGIDGIKYMIQDAKGVPLKIYFTAPSCVPATNFETNGATLGPKEVERLMGMRKIVALGEVMNYPGVINENPEIIAKINVAKKYNKPIDGHAPGLSGKPLKKYISFGISTEHEATTYKEALEKAKAGMVIMIREGSSAKNMESLIRIACKYPVFFVSDDLHPDDLINGHLDRLLIKAVKGGVPLIKAIQAVSINPATHYRLNSGAIVPGKDADIVITSDLKNFEIKKVFIDGKLVAKNGKSMFSIKPKRLASTFKVRRLGKEDLKIPCSNAKTVRVRVIQVIDKSIITGSKEAILKVRNGEVSSDIREDILKIAVIERYGHNTISKGFVKGFGLKRGAIASSVSHDSHNIIAVGVSDLDIVLAVNLIIRSQGGLSAVDSERKTSEFLNLPIAGLMSYQECSEVSRKLKRLNEFVRRLGCQLTNPFGTLSFLTLLVIPKLKISDKGLFDVEKFQLVDVCLN